MPHKGHLCMVLGQSQAGRVSKREDSGWGVRKEGRVGHGKNKLPHNANQNQNNCSIETVADCLEGRSIVLSGCLHGTVCLET
jgi:hypothetical protein